MWQILSIPAPRAHFSLAPPPHVHHWMISRRRIHERYLHVARRPSSLRNVLEELERDGCTWTESTRRDPEVATGPTHLRRSHLDATTHVDQVEKYPGSLALQRRSPSRCRFRGTSSSAHTTDCLPEGTERCLAPSGGEVASSVPNEPHEVTGPEALAYNGTQPAPALRYHQIHEVSAHWHMSPGCGLG